MGEKIVIVGAGIIGLYTALILSRQDKARDVTIIAQYLPGDQSSEYTSPWAGANFSLISGHSQAELEYDELSYRMLGELERELRDYNVIARLPATEIYQEPINEAKLASLRTYLENVSTIDLNRRHHNALTKQFKELSSSELPDGYISGVSFLTYNFNSPKLLKALQTHLTNLGVIFIRRKIAHIHQAYISSHTKVVFNCTGNGAKTLGGVEDSTCYPIRGQVVVVRAPHIQENFGCRDNENLIYVIPRPFSNGHVVVGGYYQIGNGDPNTYGFETQAILHRCRRRFPKMFEYGDPEIIREVAGHRPGRKNGPRVEKERLSNGKILIHVYGAAGTGYQSGLAMAYKAVSELEIGSKI